MKIGVFSILPDVAADPAVVAAHAESLGFASYWVPDHVVMPVHYTSVYPGNPNPGKGPDPDYLWQMPDPLIALMRAATATTTLEVGTAVLLVPERHPLHLAKEIASLDAFSGGRFHFGIGAGWNREEAEMLGVDFDRRWTQTLEAVEVMRKYWREETPSHEGRYYRHAAVRAFPKPAQRPHPPIYLPSIMFGDDWSERVFQRIVKFGDGWLPVVKEIAQVTRGRDRLHALAEQAGRDPASLRITVLGGDGQWRRRADMDAFAALGVEQVVLWLRSRDADAMRRELDELAAALAIVAR